MRVPVVCLNLHLTSTLVTLTNTLRPVPVWVKVVPSLVYYGGKVLLTRPLVGRVFLSVLTCAYAAPTAL